MLLVARYRVHRRKSVIDPRKDSQTTVTTTLSGFVISCLLASCSGGGSPGALPSSSTGSNVLTDGQQSSASAAWRSKAPAPTPSPKAVAVVATPLAPAAPDHVQNYAYYGASYVNVGIPAAYMAAHVDIVEDSGSDESYSAAFKAAGGKTALAYIDPTYMAYCPAPFKAPAGKCSGPIGKLVASTESAFVHDWTGARLNRFVSTQYQYQEILNAGNPAAVAAYRQIVNGLLAQSPKLDGVFADDSGSPLSNLYYDFSAQNGVEFPTDARWIAGESAMLAAPGIKVVYNGGGNANNAQAGPSYPSQGAPFLNVSNVIGQNFEGCLSDPYEGLHTANTPNDDFLQNDLNGMLAVQAYRKLAVCMPTGPIAPAGRLYVYASYLLAYSPAYSAFAQIQNLSDGYAVYPETQLVPQQPLTTATTDVAVLRKGSVYVREFASCAIASVPIGGCVALVNSSSASAAIPALTQSYAHGIVLDAKSLYGGGLAHVVAASVSLAPASAAILVR
jgi:hypothetical protein